MDLDVVDLSLAPDLYLATRELWHYILSDIPTFPGTNLEYHYDQVLLLHDLIRQVELPYADATYIHAASEIIGYQALLDRSVPQAQFDIQIFYTKYVNEWRVIHPYLIQEPEYYGSQ